MTRALLEQALDALENVASGRETYYKNGLGDTVGPAIGALHAELAKPQGEPDGWKLVPIEPTADMYIRGGEAFFDLVGPATDDGDTEEDQEHAASIYRAMLSAAPQAQPEQPRKERPDFIAGYMAGMADGKALRAQTERERAAKVCDDMKKAFVTAKFPTDYECSAAMNAAMKCATKIRELK